MKKLILPLFLSAFIFSCSSNPYGPSNRLYKKQAKELTKALWEVPPPSATIGIQPGYPVGTTNFNLRKPNYVLIHHTAQNACELTLKAFTMQKSQVSAHYVICKDGTIHHMLNDYFRAWHGGNAKWGNLTDINSASIGIELDNNGYESFPEAQISSLLSLLGALKKNYNIPVSNFIGHSDVAPGRKQDPNAYFPWKTLAEGGFGYWPDDVVDSVPPGFNPMHALRMIGYNTSDSSSAIKAFKLHFVQDDVSDVLNESDRAILNNLANKY